MEENLRGILQKNESFTTEKEYRESNAMSYSIFKDIYDNPEILITPREEKKEDWFVFGTIVDMLLTGSASEVDDKIIINDTVPTDQYKAIADYLIEYELNVSDLTDEQVEACYTMTGSKVNWGIPVKRQKILDNCVSYIELIKTSKDKIIVSSAIFEEATKIAAVFTGHRWTRDLFMSEVEQKANNIEIIYQYKIKYIVDNILFKSMLDVVVIDHANKIIYPYDIKTGTDYPRVFLRSAVYRYKYMYQAALYRMGLELFIKGIPELEDYEIGNFRFVYVSRIKPNYPVILLINEDIQESFINNGLYSDRYELPSVNEIIWALKHYMTRIELGDTVLEPIDLYRADGEYTLYDDIYNTLLYN